jgi:hypothetical protein
LLFDDLAGNVLSVTEWEDFGGLQFKGRTVNEYDALYRVTKETRLDPEGGTYQVTSAYDPQGNRTRPDAYSPGSLQQRYPARGARSPGGR